MGGNFDDGESQRIDHLLEAINHGASLVDIEVETEKEYMKQIRNEALQNNCQLIVSKHYPQVTPEYQDLLDLIDKMIDSGADILKVVVTPESIRDCGRILQLYSLENLETPLIAFAETPLIAFAMGNIGRFTRVSALFLGAPFMYVSQDSGEEAAPGQISMSDMRAILRSLS
jgi:3-dehydroquinate dehydratase type I